MFSLVPSFSAAAETVESSEIPCQEKSGGSGTAVDGLQTGVAEKPFCSSAGPLARADRLR
jgi:hypothetical protein